METIVGNYLVEIPKDSNDLLKLNVNDKVIIDKDIYTITGFVYYDNMLFIEGKNGSDAVGVFRPRRLKKIIKPINWSDEYPRLLRELPFDIDTLEVSKLHANLWFNLSDGIKLTICVNIDDEMLTTNELYRGSYRTQNTQQDIDFIISQ